MATSILSPAEVPTSLGENPSIHMHDASSLFSPCLPKASWRISQRPWPSSVVQYESLSTNPPLVSLFATITTGVLQAYRNKSYRHLGPVSGSTQNDALLVHEPPKFNKTKDTIFCYRLQNGQHSVHLQKSQYAVLCCKDDGWHLVAPTRIYWLIQQIHNPNTDPSDSRPNCRGPTKCYPALTSATPLVVTRASKRSQTDSVVFSRAYLQSNSERKVIYLIHKLGQSCVEHL